MRCSKSCYLSDLALVDLFDNGVSGQVEYKAVNVYKILAFYLRMYSNKK